MSGEISWRSERWGDLDDPGRLRFGDDEDPRESDPVICDWCHAPVIYLISIATLGQFCSRRCADLASEQHALAMERRRA